MTSWLATLRKFVDVSVSGGKWHLRNFYLLLSKKKSGRGGGHSLLRLPGCVDPGIKCILTLVFIVDEDRSTWEQIERNVIHGNFRWIVSNHFSCEYFLWFGIRSKPWIDIFVNLARILQTWWLAKELKVFSGEFIRNWANYLVCEDWWRWSSWWHNLVTWLTN